MPLHPAAPEDLGGLVAAYGQTAQAILDLGRMCGPEDFEKPTACPGWTVKDQFSHVVGLELWMSGATFPRVSVPDYAHVRSETGRLIESQVEARRPMLGSKVVDELEFVLQRRMTELADPALTPETPLRSLHGPRPACEALRLRIVDLWTHEQDLRHALDRPGDLDSPGASVFVDVFFQALPRLVARQAGVAPGNTVIFDVTGPVVGRAGARVETGEDGRPLGVALFTGMTREGEADEKVTTIQLSTDSLARRAAGRGGLDDIHYTVLGDQAVGRQVLEGVVLTP